MARPEKVCLSKTRTEALKLELKGWGAYYALPDHLYAEIGPSQAVEYYLQAIQLSKSPVEKQTLQARMNALNV